MADTSPRTMRLDEARPSTDAGRCPSARRPGRPPDPRLRGRILDATREVVGEVGPDRATFTRVARRVGCNPRAVSCRWPSQRRLIVDALEEVGGEVLAMPTAPAPDPDAGYPVACTVRRLTDPGVRPFVRAMVFATADDPSMADEVDRVILAPLRAQLRADLCREAGADRIRDDDMDTVVELVHAAVLVSVLTGRAVPPATLDLAVGALGRVAAGRC